MPESIQEYLIKQGFHQCDADSAFIGEDANCEQIIIPYTELASTVSAFIEKAKRKGWINADGSTKVVANVAPLGEWSWQGRYTCVPGTNMSQAMLDIYVDIMKDCFKDIFNTDFTYSKDEDEENKNG